MSQTPVREDVSTRVNLSGAFPKKFDFSGGVIDFSCEMALFVQSQRVLLVGSRLAPVFHPGESAN